MEIEIYMAEDAEGDSTDSAYGPYGYPTQDHAYEAAKHEAQRTKGKVNAYTFEFSDSELMDDFTESKKED